jgi:hypothetical protein
LRLFGRLLQTLGIGVVKEKEEISPKMTQTAFHVPTPVSNPVTTPFSAPAAPIAEQPPKPIEEQQQTGEKYPLTSKVVGLSETRGWRSLLEGGEEGVFDGIAEVKKKGENYDVLIYLDTYEEDHVKLGHLGAAASFKAACAKVYSDSDMGRAIAQNAISCRVMVYRGDIDAAIETDKYSYAYTDVLHRVKAAIKKGTKPKTKPSDTPQ